MELDPGFVPARLALGQAYVQKQMFPEAIRELEKAVDLSGGSPVYLASLAHAYGVTGRKRDTSRIIDQLENLAGRRYVASFDMALAWLGLGDHDRTLASLERSVEDGRRGCCFYPWNQGLTRSVLTPASRRWSDELARSSEGYDSCIRKRTRKLRGIKKSPIFDLKPDGKHRTLCVARRRAKAIFEQ